MMAPEFTPPPSLAPDTVHALREELVRYSREGNHSRQLHEILDRITEEARAKGMRAEHLLIALKEIWFSVVQVAPGTVEEVQQTKLLQSLISRCIEQYYAD